MPVGDRARGMIPMMPLSWEGTLFPNMGTRAARSSLQCVGMQHQQRENVASQNFWQIIFYASPLEISYIPVSGKYVLINVRALNSNCFDLFG